MVLTTQGVERLRTRVDDVFRDEAGRYALRYACEDCQHFLGDDAGCAHEWPTEDHLARPIGGHEALVVFCKEFELA